jgi:hypothetical protein
MRWLRYLWKDSNSVSGQCPALYETNGGYVVQGVKLGEADRQQLVNMADNEDAIFVPANVLDRLRDMV